MATKAQDVMDKVAAAIIESIEKGLVDGAWTKPWTASGSGLLPTNASTGKPYSGGNVFVLWMSQMESNYLTNTWATYKQWEALGAQVRRGEKGTFCVKYTPIECRDHGKDQACEKCGRVAVNTFALFNADQVEGWEAPTVEPINEEARREAIDAYISAVGATIRFGGDSAHYMPVRDEIAIPLFESFRDADSYYATVAHELVHWTGHESRLARNLSGRFGDNSYAMEELVAELGAAMLCGMLGITDTPRPDHARYLKHWLEVLKEDSKALWAAASLSSKAVAFIQSKQPEAAPAPEVVPA